jgi:hypothetical protein
VWSAPRQPPGDLQGPDWLADAITLGERQALRLGPVRPLATTILDWTDRCVVTRIRRHAVAFAAATSVLFGALVALSQGVQEGYPAGGFVFFFVIAGCGMFTFAMLAGSYLGLLGHGYPCPHSRMGTRLIRVGVATGASVPVAVAFRTAIWSLLGVHQTTFSWLALDETVLAVAAAAAILTLTVETLLRRH